MRNALSGYLFWGPSLTKVLLPLNAITDGFIIVVSLRLPAQPNPGVVNILSQSLN